MPNAADRSLLEKHELWDPEITYVIGHRRPDTDAIASALGYAWVLTQSGYDGIRAVRAGQPADQTAFALKRFGQQAPQLLTAVAPTFGHIAEPLESVRPESPLAEALMRLAVGDDQIVPVVDSDDKPVGVVTPLEIARAFSRTLEQGRKDGDGREPTCGDLVEAVPTFRERDRLSDHRNGLLRQDDTSFLVVSEEGKYVGVATQRRLLQPPRARLILVDHNELTQAVAGADEADIVGVLDHHRLGNPPTAAPIPFVVDPVGSTSTLVAEKARERALMPPKGICGMLLSGILSDTLVFRSPTTSTRDRAAAAWLANICQIDMHQWGDELLRSSPGLGSRTADEIIDGDRKPYEMSRLMVSVGQVEVTSMDELPQRRDELLAALEDRRDRENLALICLMITDVVTGRSRMLVRGENRIVSALPFSRAGSGEFDLGDIVSRKKQLAPALHNVLESV